MTGDQALTVEPPAITNKPILSLVDVADDDSAMVHDTTSGTLKKVDLKTITDAGYF